MGTPACFPLALRNVNLLFRLCPTRTFFPNISIRREASTANGRIDKSYTNAIRLLDSLQSNRAVVSSISDAPRDANLKAIPEMLEWTRKAGYDVEDLASAGLKVIHVAGTKGKGSVCAMVESILLQYQRSDRGGTHVLGKVGLYTSPHLVHVRERIRIDGAPISESMFAQYFFEIWDRLSVGIRERVQRTLGPETKPGYFRFLTILALHIFIKEGVETAILECGIGGEYDSTNIIPASTMTTTAITRLGIDHVSMLGNTMESIAWHKSGIMKSGIPCFTVLQEAAAQTVLSTRAEEKGVNLRIIPRLPVLDTGVVKLGLDGDFQKDNASLAIAIASSHLNALSLSVFVTPLPVQFVVGLETIVHPGRCQTLYNGNIEWLLDGAHTVDSIIQTGRWFNEKLIEANLSDQPPTVTMLIFAAQGIDRDPQSLLHTLIESINGAGTRYLRSGTRRESAFTYGSFCTMNVFADQDQNISTDEKKQLERLARAFQSANGSSLHVVSANIQTSVQMARQISENTERVMVLVTGSLHLVGGVLKVFEWERQQQRKVSSHQ